MDEPVLKHVHGGVGYLTLNRPQALHALNEEMCTIILGALQAWAGDPDIHMVMIDHQDGTRGFCAGGDIAMLRESGMGDGQAGRAFFAAEYKMNVAIKRFPKPYLAILDGVTMGGGVGLSVHGSFRVATERTVFAMPETGIGLFPDVGGGWFLPRLRGELGTWLAMTGARLKGGEVLRAGIATHFIPSELISNLKAQISTADFSVGAAELLGTILASLSQPVPEAEFETVFDTLNRCFAGEGAEEALSRLRSDPSDWAQRQAVVLQTKSPETVKLTLRQLREGARLERFEDNMAMEYRIGWRKIQSHDFIEGVRAVIIDKDNAPKWMPATLAEVSETQIEPYFEPLGADELTFE